jgi:Ca2+/Na+ antiporter
LIEFLGIHPPRYVVAVGDLIGGVLLIAGACEAFVISVEGISSNLNMTDYVSGIYASIASTIPELSVLTFLILGGEYEMAWVLALATIFMNTLVFAIYTLFLPKDERGNFQLPDAIMWVGSDLLSMASVISLAVGLSMLILHVFTAGVGPLPPGLAVFTSDELLVFGSCLIAVFVAYLFRITKYYGQCEIDAEDEGMACKIHEPISRQKVGVLLFFALLGALFGGEALSAFAHFASGPVAEGGLGLNFIQTALLLVIFGGTPEYIIVASSHIKDRIEVALSNAFGGIVQVFFVVFGFTLIVSGLAGGVIPVDLFSVVLLFFAFPSMFILRIMISDDSKVNNLEAIAMIAVFIMMLYMLLAFGHY